MGHGGGRFCVVLTTAGSEADARRIAAALVERRLAACVTTLAAASVYRWEGAIRDEPETLLLVKTRAALFSAVRDAILELHTYDTPEIVLLPIAEGDPRYLAWLEAETS